MPDLAPSLAQGMRTPADEIARLNKIIRALMDRAERSASAQRTDFRLFETAIMLEGEVRRRTAELEAALRDNEKVTRALRESEARFRGLVSQSLVGIVIIEAGKFSYSNAKFDEIFGYRADEVRGLRPEDVAVEEDRPRVTEELRKRLSGEVDRVDYQVHGRRKDGAVIDIEIHGNTMDIGGKRSLISLVMDITDRMRAERELRALRDRLQDLAVRDALTGLFNRRYLDETLTRELALAQRQGRPLSVIMADLDHFKRVNDTHGHAVGDEVLRQIAEILTRTTRASDICCRYGGEEFLLVLPEATKEQAAERAEELRHAIVQQPLPVGTVHIPVTVSFGVAAFPSDAGDRDALVAAADRALYAAKAAGRNCVVVSSGSSPSGRSDEAAM